MRDFGTLDYMLPWMIADIDELDEVFRGDAWTYGIAPNRPTLEALVTYLSDQAIIKEPIPIDDLFVLSHGRYDATPAGPHRLPPVGARRWHIKTSSGRSA